MRALVTGEEMRKLEEYAIGQIGIPSPVLMERAALAVVEASGRVPGMLSAQEPRILVLAGTGNNGADGVAAARIWHLRGIGVRIILVGDAGRHSPEMKRQLEIARRLHIPVENWSEADRETLCSYPPEMTLVDALFGTGLGRPLGGVFADAAEWVNDQRRRGAGVLSVDIPSGVNSENGQIMGCAVEADLTVTFGLEKLGTVFYPGKRLAGRVILADIGLPDPGEKGGYHCCTFEEADLARIPHRKPEDHKGSCGKILIAAGSSGMAGAAYFAALAAYRTGAGLVRILTTADNLPILQERLPEAIVSPCDAALAEDAPEEFARVIEEACGWADVIVLGPGLGKGRYAEKMVQHVLLSAYVPIIVDADGLGAIAEYPYLADYITDNVIITPHLGEMSRLTGLEIEDIQADPMGTAADYAEDKGVICVLKDAVTVVASRRSDIFVNTEGSAALARGGSGDLLTGVIAGLIGMGMPEEEAARCGVYLHGRAGRLAGEAKGMDGLLASEIADFIPAAMYPEKNTTCG